MSSVDDKVDRGADKLEQLVEAGSRAGGMKAKVAQMFADDPEFVRKLKPSLIVARAKGEAPTEEAPTHDEAPRPAARPQTEPKPEAKQGGGPNPFVVIAAAFAVGLLLAHVVDWLGHRYPRD
jgi:hypothetical protein